MGKKVTAPQHRDCERIKRECFWEYHLSVVEILNMAKNGTDQEKYFLFAKIIENASDVLKSLEIFSMSDLKEFIRRYETPKFNKGFLEKRYSIVKWFLTGQKVNIPELRWTL
nr:hypothetical protein [Desulfobulbaceae bacterium]